LKGGGNLAPMPKRDEVKDEVEDEVEDEVKDERLRGH
jgi:hypothetical protein